MDQETALAELIHYGREERNLEYKSSLDWSKDETKSKVIKASLAFANIRDGGTLILGVREVEKDKFAAEGMTENDFASFTQDNVQDAVNRFADPYINLKVHRLESEKKKFILIQIQQFDLLPVVCKKDGKDGLVEGQLYTRPQKKNESSVVKSQTEMREILDIAIDNGIKNFYQRLGRTGLQATPTEDVNKNQFQAELGGL